MENLPLAEAGSILVSLAAFFLRMELSLRRIKEELHQKQTTEQALAIHSSVKLRFEALEKQNDQIYLRADGINNIIKDLEGIKMVVNRINGKH